MICGDYFDTCYLLVWPANHSRQCGNDLFECVCLIVVQYRAENVFFRLFFQIFH